MFCRRPAFWIALVVAACVSGLPLLKAQDKEPVDNAPADNAPVDNAPAENAPLRLTPHWKQGEVLNYKITSTHEQIDSGQATPEWSLHHDLSIEVIAADDQGYRIGWTQSGPAAGDAEQSISLAIKLFSGLFAGQQIVIEVDRSGQIMGVANWEALRDGILAGLDALLAANADDTPPEELDHLKQQITESLQTKEGVENLVLSAPRIFLMPYGKDYALDEPTESENTTPNPFGGEPFPLREKFEVSKYDADSGIAEIVWKQTMVADKTVEILLAILDQLSTRQDVTQETLNEIRALWMRDDAIFRIDTTTSVIKAMAHRQAVRHAKGQWSADTVQLLQVAP